MHLSLMLLGMALVQQPAEDKPPVKLTAQEDHKRMMGLLGINSIRRGADGMNKNTPYQPNYDESKATPFPDLPDPLVMKDGSAVKTAEQWRARRLELLEDFDREMYGRTPKVTPKVTWEVTSTEKQKIGEHEVTTKTLVGHVDNSAYPAIKVDIQLRLSTPVTAKGPVPIIMEFGFMFGPRPGGAGKTPPPAPPRTGPNWQEQLLSKGWGFAVISPVSVQQDNGAGLTQGIIGLCNKGQPRGVEDWGSLKAWGWGASRALDYFETDKDVDAKKVGITGHSRYGKAALVTMAYDERFAIAFPSSSGAGGAKLHRRDYGEKVENVAGSGEYHWMGGNYIKYAGPLTAKDLPVDAHELVALCAPRPVFISSGSENGDAWVDAKGMFLATVGASPVYELLGKKGVGTKEFPKIDTPLIEGDVAYKQHTGGHTPGPNWPVFIQFASRYYK